MRRRQSARILGSALDGGCDDRAIVQSLLNTANPTFRLLHRLFGKHSRTPQHPEFEAYPVVEARIRKLAEQIVNAIRPKKVGARRHVGDVGDPKLIRKACGALEFYEISVYYRIIVARSCHDPLTLQPRNNAFAN